VSEFLQEPCRSKLYFQTKTGHLSLGERAEDLVLGGAQVAAGHKVEQVLQGLLEQEAPLHLLAAGQPDPDVGHGQLAVRGRFRRQVALRPLPLLLDKHTTGFKVR